MDKILELIASITKQDINFLKDNLDTENLWNSLTRVEILLTLEEEYEIFFDEEEIKEIKTINQLIKIVEGKHNI